MGKPEDIPPNLTVAEIESIAKRVARNTFHQMFGLDPSRPTRPAMYQVRDKTKVEFLPTRTIIATCIEPEFARLIVRALNIASSAELSPSEG
jgi:hypothetical protein